MRYSWAMTFEERIDALTARHEAMTMHLELRERQSEAEDRKIQRRMDRWVALGMKELRRQRQRQQEFDLALARLAAAQLITEERLAAFIASTERRNGGPRQ
jgi:hypothetical protein